MNLFRTFLAVAAAGVFSLSAADLSNIASVKRWAPYECTVTQSGKALVINMPVDHKAGQKEYPVGWPRLYLYKLTAAEKDWSKAKAVSFKFQLEFKGTSAKQPIWFQVRTQGPKDAKPTVHSLQIPDVKNKTAATVTLSLDKVKNLDNVVILGFNISEDRYKHGENVKFTVSEFKLINK
jgi:hypothetical protein